MKKINLVGAAMAAGVVFALPAFGATVVLQNGGLGQRANDAANFGVAVCNKGSKNVTQAVPVAVTSNGVSNTVMADPVNAGACTYSYLPYSAFHMAAGNTYNVQVTVDPQGSVSKSDAATYSLTVPNTATANASAVPANASGNTSFLASMWAVMQHWFSGIF